MRLGQLTRVAVPDTDLTLLVRVKWGEYRKLTTAIADKSEAEALPAVDAYLRAVIADVRGLEDDAGQALPWQPDLLEELAPATVMAMLNAMVSVGETGGAADAPLPAAAGDADGPSDR
jgi:hypothetical protein